MACQEPAVRVFGPVTFPLQSSRLTLRSWEDRDRAPFAALSADAVVMQYLTPLPTLDASNALIDRQRSQFAQHGFGYWAVELRETRQLVGAVGLSRPSFQAHFTPAVGVGWRLAPAVLGLRLCLRGSRGGTAVRLRGTRVGRDRRHYDSREPEVATGDAAAGHDVLVRR